MIGGQGEKKTLRLMAEHAEMANITSRVRRAPAQARGAGRPLRRRRARPRHHQQDAAVLRGARGRPWRRPRASATTSCAPRGMDWDTLDDGTRALVAARLVVGDPDAVGEQVAQIIGLGLDGITVNMPANGHDPDAVTHTMAVLKKAVGQRVPSDAAILLTPCFRALASSRKGVRGRRSETDVRAGPGPSGTARHNLQSRSAGFPVRSVRVNRGPSRFLRIRERRSRHGDQGNRGREGRDDPGVGRREPRRPVRSCGSSPVVSCR